MPSCDAGETLQDSDLIRLAFRKPISYSVEDGVKEGKSKPGELRGRYYSDPEQGTVNGEVTLQRYVGDKCERAC